jgi:hypothetical protein
MHKRRFWIGTVSKEHVERGKQEGIAQVCHGKAGPLKRMQANDILIYYSPQLIFGEKTPYQCFTAIGIVQPTSPYQVEMSPDFKPFRRDINYLYTVDTPIRPLIPQLNFIQDKSHWGYTFRFGLLQIPSSDFITIAKAMQLEEKQIHELLI